MTISFSGESAFFLDLYARFIKDPASVPADWRVHFELTEREALGGANPSNAGSRLRDLYRSNGHRHALLDPLGLWQAPAQTEISTIQHDSQEPMVLEIAGVECTTTAGPARERLASIYCGTATLEAGHLLCPVERSWLYESFEIEMLKGVDHNVLSRTLGAIMIADEFEGFIKTKWPTKKRFGIEGAESAAVIAHEILLQAASMGCSEVVIGGMHRGRLAILATVLGKSLPSLVSEIVGRDTTNGSLEFTGDVPYHNGLAARVETGGGSIFVRLLPHPSHLSVVAPVAVGAARARQEIRCTDRSEGNGRSGVLPFLMHTDAAFSGQGLIWELFQLSRLEGYEVGGTIHLIVNNQIGFTTLPSEGRSTTHPSDIGKAFSVPIFHVNGDDPVAAAAVARTAVAWRNKTGRDAIVNLVCYRRNGHNELDEPRFTQPTIWRAVGEHSPLVELYSGTVKNLSEAAYEVAEGRLRAFKVEIEDAYASFEQFRPNETSNQTDIFPHCSADTKNFCALETGVDRDILLDLARQISKIDPSLDIDPKVRKFFDVRLASIEEDSGFNLATAEVLAFASLLNEGTSVRLSGQDCVRGTFTQRHLAVYERDSGRRAFPLAGIATGSARFEAINSPLSEYGVLSFEYGYSLADTNRLTIWEAQFGDFLNGAQVVVDQYIMTAESKWRMTSGLVLALPHGLEGQGPDHSSARLERALQGCAERNVVVANPSTPANLFHLYRRQIRGTTRKPLILASPKSMLRWRDCISKISEISAGTSFQEILVDYQAAKKCRRVVICTGKIYYALRTYMVENKILDVALIRIEQLYPFPMQLFLAVLKRIDCVDLVWCQEEPHNQGAWSFFREVFGDTSKGFTVHYVGRPAMAAAAGGSIDRHNVEQARLVRDALEATF